MFKELSILIFDEKEQAELFWNEIIYSPEGAAVVSKKRCCRLKFFRHLADNRLARVVRVMDAKTVLWIDVNIVRRQWFYKVRRSKNVQHPVIEMHQVSFFDWGQPFWDGNPYEDRPADMWIFGQDSLQFLYLIIHCVGMLAPVVDADLDLDAEFLRAIHSQIAEGV